MRDTPEFDDYKAYNVVIHSQTTMRDTLVGRAKGLLDVVIHSQTTMRDTCSGDAGC